MFIQPCDRKRLLSYPGQPFTITGQITLILTKDTLHDYFLKDI